MKIKVFTTFPEMIRPIVSQSILGRAVENGLLAVEAIDIREYAENKHRNTDDYPFGGGAGQLHSLLHGFHIRRSTDDVLDKPFFRIFYYLVRIAIIEVRVCVCKHSLMLTLLRPLCQEI